MCLPSCHESIRLVGVGAHEEPALAARGNGHLVVDQERKPAEHLLLGQTGLAGRQVANALRQLLVVRHEIEYWAASYADAP